MRRSDHLLVLPFLLCGLLIAGICPAQSLTSCTISPSETRDGTTVTLGCLIDVYVTSTLRLSCNLAGANSEVLRSHAPDTTFTLGPGTHWETRSLRINLPPGSEMGGDYSGVWELRSPDSILAITTKTLGLKILPPLPIRVPILMYHRVLPESGYITAKLEDFVGQIQMLKAYGYTSITFDDLMAFRAGLGVPPAKPILLTADDGYLSWLKYVHPVLDNPDIRFCMTGFLQTREIDKANGNSTAPDPYMTWSQAAELDGKNSFNLYSHTVTHPHLPEIDDAKCAWELSTSKASVENNLKKEAPYLAYPYGEYSPRDQQAAWQAGYFAATTDSGGVETDCYDKWDLDRIGVYTEATLEYDIKKAYAFFPIMIGDPDVKIPLPKPEIFTLQNATTGNEIAELAPPGTTITLRLKMRNTGEATTVSAILRIWPDGASSETLTETEFLPAMPGPNPFYLKQSSEFLEWIWPIPKNAAEGSYSAELIIKDQFSILTFYRKTFPSMIMVGQVLGSDTWFLY